MYPISANAKQRFLEGGKQIARLTVINDEYEPYAGEVYNVPFSFEGQNIFTRENEEDGKYLNSSGVYTNNANYAVSDYLEIEPQKRYVIVDASHATATAVYHAWYDENKTFIRSEQWLQEFIIPPSNAKYLRVSYRKDGAPTSVHIEVGIVPHGIVDVATGVLSVDYAYISDLSYYTFSVQSDALNFIFRTYPLSGMKIPETSAERLTGIACSGYRISLTTGVNNSFTPYATLRNAGRLYFRNDDYSGSTASDFKASLDGIEAIYELETPCTYQLTPQEVRTLLGYNNIWSDTGTVNLSYRNTSGEVVAKSGDMVSIDDGAKNIPLASLSLPLLPKQDLHGYDYPWVGGGGKNICPNIATYNDTEINGVRVTVNADGSIYIKGTTTANVAFNITDNNNPLKLKANVEYTISGCPSNGGLNKWAIRLTNAPTTSTQIINEYGTGAQYTPSSDGDYGIRIIIWSGQTVDFTFYPMVRAKTGTTAEYAPYENICPITGYTEANVTRTGKNLFDLNDLTATGITIENGVASGMAKMFYQAFRLDKNGIPNLRFSQGAYTISCDAYTDGNQGTTTDRGVYFRFRYTDGTDGTSTNIYNNATNWTHSSATSDASKTVAFIYMSYGNQPNNIWHIKNIQLQSEAQTVPNLVITEDKIIEGGLSVNRYCTTGKAVMVGSVVAGEMNAVLNNEDGAFNDVNFIGHDIKVEVGTMDGDTPDYIPLGYFQVDDSPKKLAHISLTTLDRMMLLEKDIDESKLEFPMTVNNLFSIICNECGVTPASGQTLLNGDYEIEAYPENVQTYRDLLSCIAEISGTCAYFDWNGELRLEWFNPTPAVELNTHNRTSSDLSEESVIITGVEVKASDGDYLAGDDGFLLTVAQNPLITHDYQSVADSLYNARGNFGYRPFTANTLPMPYLYPLDTATFVDKNGNESVVAITDWTFRLNRNTDLRGRGESTLQASFKKKYGLTEGGVSIDEAIGLLRDTIIKNAEIVNQSMEELSRALHGEYEAISSEFGTYRNETDAKITANAEGITQAYSNIEEIDSKYGVAVNDTNQAVLALGDGAVATNTKFRELTEAYIKSGKLYYEGATPVYGVAVGQLTYETVGGEELVKRKGVYSVFTSEELAFYIDDVKVAYMRNKKLYINEAEFVSSVKIGRFTLEDGTNGFTIK